MDNNLPISTAPDKPQSAEIKNGKATLKQRPISFEKNSETLHELIAFREMLESRAANTSSVLDTVPDEYKPLIAKLVHESEKTASFLVKRIVQELSPEPEEDDNDKPSPPSISAIAVENAIKEVASRVNYGLDPIAGYSPPANLCVWRWEVKPHLSHYLPKNAREKAESRRKERVEAKDLLTSQFHNLPSSEQEKLFGHLKFKQCNPLPEQNLVGDTSKPILHGPTPSPKKLPGTENDAPSHSNPKPQSKKTADPLKAAKEQVRIDKKNAKMAKEKRDEEGHRRAQSMMNNFFKKPSTATMDNSPCSSPSKATKISDFAKSFKPFVVRKNTVVAPLNPFRRPSSREDPDDDDDDVIIVDPHEESGSTSHRFRRPVDLVPAFQDQIDVLRASKVSSTPPKDRTRRSVVTAASPAPSVRDAFSRLSEAEVTGDIPTVHALHRDLSNRQLFPAKVFIFTEDNRPGYFGTWTKTSKIIGPRHPLARDVISHDYGYDSGEDWEDERAEDGEDIVDDEDEGDGDADDADSDADSWLVDDDDEIETETVEQRGESLEPPPFRPTKRKEAGGGGQHHVKRRKVVVPLVPFVKGPYYETALGETPYEPFKPYALRLLNDTPFPIDPFTFVSTAQEENRMQQKHANKAGPQATGDFIAPQLPARLGDAQSHPTSTTEGMAPPKGSTGPKTAFPNEHLGYLKQKITSLKASSLPFLIETLYEELRIHKVKKNAIEAKVRAIAEKRERVWMLKQIEADSFMDMNRTVKVEA